MSDDAWQLIDYLLECDDDPDTMAGALRDNALFWRGVVVELRAQLEAARTAEANATARIGSYL